MATASWLTVLSPLLIGGSYAAWSFGRLPRTRILLGIVGTLCLAVAIWQHGYFFSAAAPPVPPALGLR